MPSSLVTRMRIAGGTTLPLGRPLAGNTTSGFRRSRRASGRIRGARSIADDFPAGDDQGMCGGTRPGRPVKIASDRLESEAMATIHQATLTPTKLELLEAWLPGRHWYPADEAPGLQRIAACRFDDPAGEVGV